MRTSLALRILAVVGIMSWLAAAVANALEAPNYSGSDVLWLGLSLTIVSSPYFVAVLIAWAKKEFAGAMLVPTAAGLAAQLYVQVDLYFAPPDGQNGFIVAYVLVAQMVAVLLAAVCAEAVEAHRKNKAERAGRTAR